MNRGSQWWAAHPELRKQKDRQQYIKHRAKKLAAGKRWREANIERCRINDKNRRLRTREQRAVTARLWRKKEYVTNPVFKLGVLVRSRLWYALKGGIKSVRTEKLIGCPFDVLRQWLESQFTEEMTWENHGSLWEIDHIKPCCHFDLEKPEELAACARFSNLQPLEIDKHRKKSGKERSL